MQCCDSEAEASVILHLLTLLLGEYPVSEHLMLMSVIYSLQLMSKKNCERNLLISVYVQ